MTAVRASRLRTAASKNEAEAEAEEEAVEASAFRDLGHSHAGCNVKCECSTIDGVRRDPSGPRDCGELPEESRAGEETSIPAATSVSWPFGER